MHHQLARTPRSSLRGWGSVNGDRSRTRDHGAVRCAVHLGGQQDDRRTSDFPSASRSVHRRRSPQLARPHGSTPIGDQGLGAGISRLSGFPSPTSSRGFPCALSCPLLRSTSRAGRAGREGRRPNGSDAEPQEAFRSPPAALEARTRRAGRAHCGGRHPVNLAHCLQDAAPPGEGPSSATRVVGTAIWQMGLSRNCCRRWARVGPPAGGGHGPAGVGRCRRLHELS
jgi:hypothetical protein